MLQFSARVRVNAYCKKKSLFGGERDSTLDLNSKNLTFSTSCLNCLKSDLPRCGDACWDFLAHPSLVQETSCQEERVPVVLEF